MKLNINMKITKVELHNSGFDELRAQPGVIAEIKRRAEMIAAAAGEGMVVGPVQMGRSRASVAVFTATDEARKAEAEDRALLTALDAGR